MMLRRAAATLATIGLSLLLCAGAQADARQDPNGYRFVSSALTVHENAGEAVITIVRGDTSIKGQVRYITIGAGGHCNGTPCSAVAPYDYTPVKARIDFPKGVASESFTVPIVDHGVFGLNKTIQVSLFGPYPMGLADPSTVVLTIVDDDQPVAHDPANPLGLPTPPPAGNPLAGARFFVDHQNEPSAAAHQFPALNAIAGKPGTARFGSFSGRDVGVAVSRYLARAAYQEPGTVPMLATYRIVDGHCGAWSDPPADQRSYRTFITRFAQGIGDYRAVLFLEMDSLITTPCLTPQGVAVRMHELHDAIDILTAKCPRLVIYLDAGAADAVPAKDIAAMLRRAGIAEIQGFFLNSTHFDWTSHEIAFGEQVSRLTGGKHFVVNTGENGRGPLAPPDIVRQGNEVLCNPPGRGLGPRPTTNTGYTNVDAFAWTSNPGESGGPCVPGAPKTGQYWPTYALMLVRNAVYAVDNHTRIGRFLAVSARTRSRSGRRYSSHTRRGARAGSSVRRRRHARRPA
jgi:endoglucanase